MEQDQEGRQPDGGTPIEIYIAQPDGQQGADMRVRKPLPRLVKVLVPVVAALAVLFAAAAAFWRPAVLAAFGAKSYYWLVESQSVTPALKSAAAETARQPAVYSTYDLTLQSKIGTGGGTAAIDGLYANSVLSDSVFDLKLYRDTAQRKLTAALDWRYKSASVLTAQCIADKNEALVGAPALLKETLCFKATDNETVRQLLGRADQFAAKQPARSDKAALTRAFRDIFGQVNATLSDRNVTVVQHVTQTVDDRKVTCDKITVRLSQAELRGLLHKALDTARKNTTFSYYIDNSSGLRSLTAATTGAPGGDSGDGDTIDKMVTGGVSMTLLVKNGLFGSQVISRELTADDGDGFLITSQGNRGRVTLISADSDASAADKTYYYVNAPDTLTVTNGAAGGAAAGSDASVKLKLTVDKKHRTALGVPLMALTEDYSGSGSQRISVTADGGKTKFVMSTSSMGSEVYNMTATVLGSNEPLGAENLSEEGAVDPISQPQQSAAVAAELQTNLTALFKTIGLSSGNTL